MNAARKTLTTTGLATAAAVGTSALSKKTNPPFSYKGPGSLTAAPAAAIVTSKIMSTPSVSTIDISKKPLPMVQMDGKLYNPEVAKTIKHQTEVDNAWNDASKMGGRRRRRKSTKRRSTKKRRRSTKRRK
jgi:hypothetical protein